MTKKTETNNQKNILLEYIKKYFPQEQWDNAYKVMMGESGGRNDAENINTNGSRDLGLFQINEIHAPAIKAKFGYDYDELIDPAKNIEVAKWIYDRNQGWRPWVVAQNLGIDKVPYTYGGYDIDKGVQITPTPTVDWNPEQKEFIETFERNVKNLGGREQGIPVVNAQEPIMGSVKRIEPTPSKKNPWEKYIKSSPFKVSAAESTLNAVNSNRITPNPYTTPYTVKTGDTLWDIAQRSLGSGSRWKELQGYTGAPTQMPIGTKITTPPQMSFAKPYTPTQQTIQQPMQKYSPNTYIAPKYQQPSWVKPQTSQQSSSKVSKIIQNALGTVKSWFV